MTVPWRESGREVTINSDRRWQHPWFRIQRLIRAILEIRRDEAIRPVMKVTLRDALREREKIRRAGWFS